MAHVPTHPVSSGGSRPRPRAIVATRPHSRRAGACVGVCVLLLGIVTAAAQPKAKAQAGGGGGAGSAKPATGGGGAPAKPATGGDVESGKPNQGKPKVFDFTGLDISGRLRTPQLLYFLDRANEELERASLERRSFIPEMVRSVDEGPL